VWLTQACGVRAQVNLQTPLHAAAFNGALSCVEALLAHGADTEARDKARHGLLCERLPRRCTHDAPLAALTHACPLLCAQRGRTPLHRAARAGKVSCVEALCARGADVEAREQVRMRCSSTQQWWWAPRLLPALMHRVSLWAVAAQDGLTPLLVAACASADCVAALLRCGADKHATNRVRFPLARCKQLALRRLRLALPSCLLLTHPRAPHPRIATPVRLCVCQSCRMGARRCTPPRWLGARTA
jgi:hypothetical protein